MNEIIKSYKKGRFWGALICFILAVLNIYVSFENYNLIGNKQILSDINSSDLKEGNAQLTINYIYDYFASVTDKKGKETARYYFVPIETKDRTVYIACEFSKTNIKKASSLIENIGNFSNSKITSLSLTGTVKHLSGDLLDCFNNYIAEIEQHYGISADEARSCFIPYVFKPISFIFYLFVLGLLFLYFSIKLFIKLLRGDALKPIKLYCQNSSIPNLQLSQIDTFYHSTPERNDVRVNDDFFLYTGSPFVICDTRDVLWIYKNTTEIHNIFIPMGSVYSVIFRLANGETIQVSSKESEVDSLLDYFTQKIPDALAGYNSMYEKMYTENKQQMIDLVHKNHDERCGTFS